MSMAVSPSTPNEHLRQTRTRLGITTREVAALSQKIAATEGNPEFHISNGWLTQIENSAAVPSIHKLYSLSVIYRLNITELFLLFGIDLRKFHQHQLTSPLPHTHLASLDCTDLSDTAPFPTRFHPSFDLRHTNLLSRMVEKWGQVPLAFIRSLDVRNTLYGYVGLEDYMLYPLLRPGSFVQIDPTTRRIQARDWPTEYERPIYFVELRDGYRCSWCDLRGDELWLVPHPLSPSHSCRLVLGVDGEIVGKVTAAAICFSDFDPNRPTMAKPPEKP
jgi:transcriptional regulator with XRE-family HTH domain